MLTRIVGGDACYDPLALQVLLQILISNMCMPDSQMSGRQLQVRGNRNVHLLCWPRGTTAAHQASVLHLRKLRHGAMNANEPPLVFLGRLR